MSLDRLEGHSSGKLGNSACNYKCILTDSQDCHGTEDIYCYCLQWLFGGEKPNQLDFFAQAYSFHATYLAVKLCVFDVGYDVWPV